MQGNFTLLENGEETDATIYASADSDTGRVTLSQRRGDKYQSIQIDANQLRGFVEFVQSAAVLDIRR